MKQFLTTIAIMALCALTGAVYIINSPRRATALVAFLIFAVAAVDAYAAFRKKNILLLIPGIMAVSFIIRAYYILYTPTWVRQHDVIGFSQGFGQAAFIEYFCEKIRLIDFDPRKYWGFFQPPLHHMIAGLWLRLNKLTGISYEHACENVQCLTLFYSIMINMYTVKLLRQLRIKGGALVAGCALVACSPCLILMSGSINNDILCTLLQIMAAYYFIRWMEKEDAVSIMLSGLCLGLSMMTKLSGILLAPAMAVIFVYRFFRKVDITSIKKYIPQYLLFALASIPLGVWSPVRNLVKFNVPLNFTPEVGEPIEGVSVIRRIMDIWTLTPFTNLISKGSSYDEYNLPLALLKTSLTGEENYSSVFLGNICGWMLLIFGAAMSICVLFCIIKKALPSSGSTMDGQVYVFLSVYMAVSIGFVARLSFSIPNFSSQDFRYIAHAAVVGAIFVASRLWDISGSESGKKSRILIYFLTAAFCMASVLMYLVAGTVTWR